MKKNSYDIEAEVESFHWWFVVRKKLLKSILPSTNVLINALTLDIGCGVGSNLNALGSVGLYKTVGLDRSFYALCIAKSRLSLPLINGDLNQLPVRSKSCGLIIAMDILEHLEDDANGIRELYRVLKNEGILILTVPAFGFLWGIQDVMTGHKRRYSKKEITKELTEAGFEIMKSSYFNFFLFFPILMARRMIHIFGVKIESENRINFPLINFFLKAIFFLEPYVLKHFSFPIGVSIFCIAKKSEKI